jgi:hypothetical protein
MDEATLRCQHPARSAAPADRAAAWAIVAAVTGFVGLAVPAMRAYPGGTVWNRASRGSDFWLNYLSDLQRSVALNGEPNAKGALYARAAMLVLALGLAPVWWLLPRRFPFAPRLGLAVRVCGMAGVAGALAVCVMPSDRFGSAHAFAIVLGGVPGLAAGVLATAGLAAGRAEHPATIVGTAAMGLSVSDFVLYVERLASGGPELPVVAVLERLSILLVLAWMCVIARSGARPLSR